MPRTWICHCDVRTVVAVLVYKVFSEETSPWVLGARHCMKTSGAFRSISSFKKMLIQVMPTQIRGFKHLQEINSPLNTFNSVPATGECAWAVFTSSDESVHNEEYRLCKMILSLFEVASSVPDPCTTGVEPFARICKHSNTVTCKYSKQTKSRMYVYLVARSCFGIYTALINNVIENVDSWA